MRRANSGQSRRMTSGVAPLSLPGESRRRGLLPRLAHGDDGGERGKTRPHQEEKGVAVLPPDRCPRAVRALRLHQRLRAFLVPVVRAEEPHARVDGEAGEALQPVVMVEGTLEIPRLLLLRALWLARDGILRDVVVL